MHVTCGCGSVLLWRRCNVLCTSGFVDDIMVHTMGPMGQCQAGPYVFERVCQVAVQVGRQTVFGQVHQNVAPEANSAFCD